MKLWTIIIRGGDEIHLKVDGRRALPLDHDGVLTVWKFLGSHSELEPLVSLLTGPLVKATVETHVEGFVEEDHADV